MSKIPNKKHSDDELSDLRARSAMQSDNSPIVETYNKKIAHKGMVVLGYLLPLSAPLWATLKTMAKSNRYQMSDFYIMAIPIILALILALWIALKRELSRHNSAFILMLSMFSCFAIADAVNKDKYLKDELMSLIGKGQPVTDPLLDSESDSEGDDTKDVDVGDALRKAEEELRRERREWELENSKKGEDAVKSTTPDR